MRESRRRERQEKGGGEERDACWCEWERVKELVMVVRWGKRERRRRQEAGPRRLLSPLSSLGPGSVSPLGR